MGFKAIYSFQEFIGVYTLHVIEKKNLSIMEAMCYDFLENPLECNRELFFTKVMLVRVQTGQSTDSITTQEKQPFSFLQTTQECW